MFENDRKIKNPETIKKIINKPIGQQKDPKPKKRKGMKWWEFYKDKRDPTPDVEEEREIVQEEPPVIAPQGVAGPEKGGVFPNKKN